MIERVNSHLYFHHQILEKIDYYTKMLVPDTKRGDIYSVVCESIGSSSTTGTSSGLGP